MSETKFKGSPVRVAGEFITAGAEAPAFELVKSDLSPLRLSDLKGKRVVLNIFPSLDTSVCATSVRKFNKLAASLPDTVVVAVSKDLPFAHARFCTTEGIENVVPASDFRASGFDGAYGVLMASKGYGFLWAGFVSAFAFCGSMQYVAITLLTTAFDPLQAFVLSLMVNARHLFFALALLPKYRGLGRLRYFMIYTLSDENFSLSSSVEPPEDTDPTLFYFAMSFLTWLYWVAFSMLGGLLGGLITFDITGIDFALTALFVVLFIEQVVKKENRAPGAAGLVCAVAGLAVFGADNMVIPAMVLTLAVLLLGRRKLCA